MMVCAADRFCAADPLMSVTDSKLVTASKEEVPDDLEGRCYHKAVLGPQCDEPEGTLPGMKVGCG